MSRNVQPKGAKPKSVRVWSEVGVTLPIGDTYAHFRVSFGHERISPTDSTKDLKETTNLVDEFNEEQLDKMLRKYSRMVREALEEVTEESLPDRQKQARKKLGRK